MTLAPTRRTALGLGLAAAAAVPLAACGSDDAAGDSDLSDNQVGAMSDFAADQTFKATEPLTFTTLYSDNPSYPYSADWLLWSAITSTTNVTLEPTVVPMSDYEQKRSVLVSAGDAPMIIPKTYPGQESAFVTSGAVLPVSDYVDLMPNFQKKVSEWALEDSLQTLVQEDGKYYVLPGLHEEVWPDYTLAVRTDVFEKLGIATPATWDELATALATIKKAHPDSYPFSDRFEGDATLQVAALGFGTLAGWDFTSSIMQYRSDTDDFAVAPTTDAYRALVTYFQGLVADGLMDPESFTQDDDQAIQKFVTGKSFVISTNSQNIEDYKTSMDSTLGAGNYSVAKIVIPGGPAGDLMGSSRLENGIMINASALASPNFVAMMQFIDWLWYSDEGEEFAKWGVEGTTYTKAADGTRSLAEGIDFLNLNPDGGDEDLRVDYGFSGGVFAYGGTTELLHSTMIPAEIAFQEAMAASRTPTTVAPPWPLTDVEREQATLLSTTLNDYAAQMTLKFITGQRDLSEWDAYVTEMEGKGATEYAEMANTAYQRYTSGS